MSKQNRVTLSTVIFPNGRTIREALLGTTCYTSPVGDELYISFANSSELIAEQPGSYFLSAVKIGDEIHENRIPCYKLEFEVARQYDTFGEFYEVNFIGSQSAGTMIAY